MKCKVLILTHGKLAGSLYDTVKFIYGSTDGLAYLNMPEPFDQSAYGKMIADIVSENEVLSIRLLSTWTGCPEQIPCQGPLRAYHFDCMFP